MLLSVRNLRVGTHAPQGSVELVRGINVEIDEGEVVALVGESGSGKSLTALSITRLLPSGVGILSGEVYFEGRDLARLAEDALHEVRGRKVGMIFQDPLSALNPSLSIGSQLGDVIKSRIRSREIPVTVRAVEALRAVGIPHPEQALRSYPHQLSGGMRQRVLIAMALVGQPKLILADEPTTALDVTVQAKIIRLLRSVRRSANVAILFISHNLDLVAEFCDRIVVLYGGRVMEQGTSTDILYRSRHPYTRALLDCIPRLDTQRGRLKVIDGQPPANVGAIAGCPFVERCPRKLEVCAERVPELTSHSDKHSFHCWNPRVD